MRVTRIYLDQQLHSDAVLKLDGDTSHYLGKVLRLRIGAELHVFNADHGEFSAKISATDKHSMTITVGALLRTPQAASLRIHLGLGVSRGDRMDFAIQKSTELGVSVITPVYTQYGEVKLKPDRADNKLRHWRKIAINAAEQCGRLDVPDIAPLQSLAEFHASLNPGMCVLLDPTGDTKLATLTPPQTQHIALLIGPEGGFAEPEVAWGKANGFAVVSLGDRILRTETAPIAVLAILQHRFGDM